MRASRLSDRIIGWFRGTVATGQSKVSARRGARDHVVILDGTLSSLEPGYETNAGCLYRLLQEVGGDLSIYYESGLQWSDWRSASDIAVGRGINRQICRATVRRGINHALVGYSRGAMPCGFAGAHTMLGLLNTNAVRQAYPLSTHGARLCAALLP
ncbi:MAG: hypothetical protein ACE367_05495 [Acidimicrobiales bacterium]